MTDVKSDELKQNRTDWSVTYSVDLLSCGSIIEVIEAIFILV